MRPLLILKRRINARGQNDGFIVDDKIISLLQIDLPGRALGREADMSKT